MLDSTKQDTVVDFDGLDEPDVLFVDVDAVKKHLPGRHNQQNHAGFPSGDRYQAVYDYTNKNYVAVNSILRGQIDVTDPDEFTPKQRREAQQVINKLIEAFQVDAKETDVEIEAWRGVRRNDFLNAMSVGEYFVDPAFLSTSGSKKAAQRFAELEMFNKDVRAVMKITIPPGVKTLMGLREGEDEIILDRNTPLRLLRVDRSAEIPVFEFEVVRTTFKHLAGKHDQRTHGRAKGHHEGQMGVEDARVFVRRENFRQGNRLNLEEKDAINLYTASGHEMINTGLRGNMSAGVVEDFRKRMKPYVEALDSAIAKHPGLDEPVIVHRGFWSEDLIEAWESLDAGDVIEDAGYSSTSLSQQAAGSFSMGDAQIQAEILLPKGQKFLIANPGEQELLLPRGTKFKIKTKERFPIDDGGDIFFHRLVMEVV